MQGWQQAAAPLPRAQRQRLAGSSPADSQHSSRPERFFHKNKPSPNKSAHSHSKTLIGGWEGRAFVPQLNYFPPGW